MQVALQAPDVRYPGAVGTTSRDVAQFILEEHGDLDTWKLQKLVYNVQAWHLAEYGSPAFDDEIQAFVDGPVARDLFAAHQNQKFVHRIWKGDPKRVEDSVREMVRQVWDHFGSENGATLRELSHAEPAWIEAREGLKPNEPSDRPLSPATMAATTKAYLAALDRLPSPTDEQVSSEEGLTKYLRQASSAIRSD